MLSLAIWLMKAVLLCLHSLEEFAVWVTGRDLDKTRAMWATNYVMVARKAPSLEAVKECMGSSE
jgi:hypothetical protein